MSNTKVRFPIVIKISGIFALISLLAIVSMAYSIIVAQATEGDAAAINLSGSLRMQSYRMASAMQQSQTTKAELLELATEFENRLTSNTLKNAVPKNPNHSTNEVYLLVNERWKAMKPLVLGNDETHIQYLLKVDSFVDNIDRMVREFQINSEQKIRYLRTVQVISIILSILATLIAVFLLRNNVVRPLGILTRSAARLQDGNFTERSNYRSHDELGLLSETFDQMADNLSGLYSDLEEKVREKTMELQRSHESLQVLYKAAKDFGEKPDNIIELTPGVLRKLQEVTNCPNIAFCQHDKDSFDSYVVLTESDELKNLIRTQIAEGGFYSEHQGNDLQIFHIRHHETHFGELIVQKADELNPGQMQLFQTMADIFASAIRLAKHAEDEARVALASERAIIARELHDSLAQALSYQNIQTTRLKKSIAAKMSEDKILEIIRELQEGITGSYKQLRELITTFRIKSDAPGLRPALETTIDEFNHYSTTKFHLRYQMGVSLAPNEEIHCLHIVREALSNVIKHANASVCDIDALFDGEKVILRIRDNGVGLPINSDKHGHYGLTILEERATRMGGTLEFKSPESHGTEVQVQFTPKIIKSTELEEIV